MKIWTVTYNDEYSSPSSQVFTSLEDAEDARREWLQCYRHDYPDVDYDAPNDQIFDQLCDKMGFIDSITVQEHQISIPEPTDPTEKAYVEAAQRIHTDEGTVEVDDNAIVSISEDGGAYVSAWVWVYADQADVCDDCGTLRRADGQCDCEVDE